MDLKETDILGSAIDRHWYYVSKAKAMMRHIGAKVPEKILDIGAGSGFFSKYLLKNSTAREAWCVDIAYEHDHDTRLNEKEIHYRSEIGTTEADLVLLMDVLEHVDDDVGLLRFYAHKVPRGAIFLVSVPAFQMLWSQHDEFLEHKRRYTIRQLEEAVCKAGLEIKHSAYFFGMIFPIAAIMRLAQRYSKPRPPRSQLVQHHPMVNAFLKTLCDIESPLFKLNRVVGLTVFCLAQKP
ncbi:methyltransferase domain-containing protein [Ramlibacter sp. 2FC]|uniref:class I SAM-dependent methyltransferase n=1 Tax=Ramlibacter sp. 2FC TaxID=2502188 RepID=UPI0010F83C3B|nr:methyltransferase domain-containing protein [Ramlibacter sp. 2FC]